MKRLQENVTLTMKLLGLQCFYEHMTTIVDIVTLQQ